MQKLKSTLWLKFVSECVYRCVSLPGCVFFHADHRMGTKPAVCAPSSTEMYTWDNRRLQSFSIGAALLIVPREQWAFLSPSVLFSLCVFLSNAHVQTACLMIKWTNQMHVRVEQKPDPCSITPMCPDKLSHAEMSTSHCRRGSSGAGTPLSVGERCCWGGWWVFPCIISSHDLPGLQDNVTSTWPLWHDRKSSLTSSHFGGWMLWRSKREDVYMGMVHRQYACVFLIQKEIKNHLLYKCGILLLCFLKTKHSYYFYLFK